MRTKLFYLLLLLSAPAWLGAGVIADGDGYFPVLVIVTNERGFPLQGVTVQLEDSGRRDPESMATPEDRYRMSLVGQPADTNAHGAAVLLYYGGWASTQMKGNKTYSRSIHGKVIIDISGYERVERGVAEVAGGKNTTVSSGWAPVVYVTLKRKPPAETKPK